MTNKTIGKTIMGFVVFFFLLGMLEEVTGDVILGKTLETTISVVMMAFIVWGAYRLTKCEQ